METQNINYTIQSTEDNTIGGTNTNTKRRHRPMGTYHTKCRINWTREGTEILKQRSLEYIRSQPDDNTYYTDGSGDGTVKVCFRDELGFLNCDDICMCVVNK